MVQAASFGPATLQAIADRLGLTRRWVVKLRKQDIISNPVTLDEARLQFLAYRERLTPAGSNEAAVDFNRERALLTKEQRIGHELKNAQLRKELAPLTVITGTLAIAATRVKAHFQTLPGEIKKKLPTVTATELLIIDRCITKCLNTIAAMPDIRDDIIKGFYEDK